MPDYRRNRVPGGTFFFTVNLHDRRANLLVTQIGALRQAGRQARARAPFHIDAGNPEQQGLVEHPADWPYSSFHRCVASGIYPAGWLGGGEPSETGEGS